MSGRMLKKKPPCLMCAKLMNANEIKKARLRNEIIEETKYFWFVMRYRKIPVVSPPAHKPTQPTNLVTKRYSYSPLLV